MLDCSEGLGLRSVDYCFPGKGFNCYPGDHKNGPVDAKLEARTYMQFGGSLNRLAVNEGTVGRAGVGQKPTTVLQLQLGMLPGNGRPLFLVEDNLTGSGVAAYINSRTRITD